MESETATRSPAAPASIIRAAEPLSLDVMQETLEEGCRLLRLDRRAQEHGLQVLDRLYQNTDNCHEREHRRSVENSRGWLAAALFLASQTATGDDDVVSLTQILMLTRVK